MSKDYYQCHKRLFYNILIFLNKLHRICNSLELLKRETSAMVEKDDFKNLIKLVGDEKNEEKRKRETEEIIKKGKETLQLWEELKSYEKKKINK